MDLAQADDRSDAFAAWGSYFSQLLDDRTWVSRRVETVRLLDRSRTERRVSLDLDSVRLLQLAGTNTVDDGDLLLPVAILRKRLLLDLDVRDSSGNALSVVTSDVDSRAALALLLAVLREQLPGLSVPDEALSRLHMLLRTTSSRPFSNFLYSLRPPTLASRIRGLGRLQRVPVSEVERQFWMSALPNQTFRTRLFELVVSYLLIVRVPRDPKPGRIIKLRYVDQAIAFRLRALQQLSLVSTRIPVPAAGIGFASREHTRVDAPFGTRIIDVDLRTGRGRGTRVNLDLYERRVSFDRAVVYTSELERGNYLVWVRLLARSGNFTIPSILSTFLMATLSALVLTLQLQQTNLDWLNGRSGSVVALLTLTPSLTVAYLARPGEHELIGRLLALPRILVAAGALSVLSVAAGLALGNAEWVTDAASTAAIINGSLLVLQSTGFIRVQLANLRRYNINRFNDRRR